MWSQGEIQPWDHKCFLRASPWSSVPSVSPLALA